MTRSDIRTYGYVNNSHTANGRGVGVSQPTFYHSIPQTLGLLPLERVHDCTLVPQEVSLAVGDTSAQH